MAEADITVADLDVIKQDPALLELIKTYMQTHPAVTAAKAKEDIKRFENVNLNIAVTGESGVGKSTFINTLRGVTDEDEGVAATGVTETTFKTVRYSHPTMPNLHIWDLPGIGTPNFKAKTYLKEVKFDTFDFFIIICAVRFKENDIALAKQIKKMKKLFYFVHSKIDQVIQAEVHRLNVDEDKVLSKIRSSCVANLQSVGSPPVFLISGYDIAKYDFPNLISTLENNLPDHKQAALVMSLPVYSTEVIEKKKRMLYKTAGATAAGAATTTTIPIPGFSVGCEIGIMTKYLETAYITFGLDDDSIHRLAERVNKTEEELKAAMTSRFAEGVNTTVVAAMLKTAAMVTAKTFETILATCPFTSIGAMGISFGTTLHLLRHAIKEMSEDAKAVISVAGL